MCFRNNMTGFISRSNKLRCVVVTRGEKSFSDSDCRRRACSDSAHDASRMSSRVIPNTEISSMRMEVPSWNFDLIGVSYLSALWKPKSIKHQHRNIIIGQKRQSDERNEISLPMLTDRTKS